MPPVVRISDEVFRRLQTYGVPLVDTPSTVIEKVLNLLEQKEVALQPDNGSAVLGPTVPGEWPGLFLAPAHSQNLQATVLNAVSVDQIRDLLPKSDLEAVRKVADEKNGVRAWAMTRNSRAIFAAMRPGDVVMFTEKGTGKFGYAGRVLLKLESQVLGERLWHDIPNLPWELVYLLGNIRKIGASKTQVLSELEYDENFVVPGITRVPAEKVAAAISKHGVLEQVLSSLP